MSGIDRTRLALARRHVAAVPLDEIGALLHEEDRHREDARARRMPTGRRAGGNPRCRACHRFMSFGGSCGSCGYVDGIGYPGQ